MIRTHLFSLIFFGIISLNVGQRVNFQDVPVDRAKCYWIERRSPGRGPRDFEVYCTTPQRMQYSCKYRGNPHGCNFYNRRGNQMIFYMGLAREAARNQDTACSRDSLVHPYQCTDVRFNKRQ